MKGMILSTLMRELIFTRFTVSTILEYNTLWFESSWYILYPIYSIDFGCFCFLTGVWSLLLWLFLSTTPSGWSCECGSGCRSLFCCIAKKVVHGSSLSVYFKCHLWRVWLVFRCDSRIVETLKANGMTPEMLRIHILSLWPSFPSHPLFRFLSLKQKSERATWFAHFL